MRDVTPNPNRTPPVDVKYLVEYLIEFIKNPVQKIRHLPHWNWPTLFSFHVVLAITSGVLAGLLKFNGYRIAFGLFLMPFVSTISTLLLSLGLYYYFQFFEKRTESYRKVFTLIVLSSVPFFIFQVLAEYLSFISVIGFAMTSLLGIVGLCDNFRVEKKRAYIIVGSVFTLIVLTWINNTLI